MDFFEEPENQGVFLDDKIQQKDGCQSKSSIHGHAEVHFGVKGWSPKTNINIFEKTKNHRVILDHKVWT